MAFVKEDKTPPIIIVATADGHVNSCVGLCPKKSFELEVGRYSPSREQRWLWGKWKDFWDRITELKKDLGGEVWWINAGDGADDNSHSRYGLITLNKSLIVRLAVESYQPAVDASDRRFFVRGTPAHVGTDGELEEIVAKECNAEMWKGMYTRYAWELEANSTRILARHKPISNSTREYTRGGGANRTAVQMTMAAARLGRKLPDIAFSGHFHHYEDSGGNYPVRVVFLRCWKLHGSYDQYMGFSIEPIGGEVTICYEDRYRMLPTKDWSYIPREEKAWKPQKLP